MTESWKASEGRQGEAPTLLLSGLSSSLAPWLGCGHHNIYLLFGCVSPFQPSRHEPWQMTEVFSLRRGHWVEWTREKLGKNSIKNKKITGWFLLVWFSANERSKAPLQLFQTRNLFTMPVCDIPAEQQQEWPCGHCLLTIVITSCWAQTERSKAIGCPTLPPICLSLTVLQDICFPVCGTL